MLGVWPDGSDGSDINAAHRSNDGQLVLTADDFGGLKLFHAPCAAHLASHSHRPLQTAAFALLGY